MRKRRISAAVWSRPSVTGPVWVRGRRTTWMLGRVVARSSSSAFEDGGPLRPGAPDDQRRPGTAAEHVEDVARRVLAERVADHVLQALAAWVAPEGAVGVGDELALGDVDSMYDAGCGNNMVGNTAAAKYWWKAGARGGQAGLLRAAATGPPVRATRPPSWVVGYGSPRWTPCPTRVWCAARHLDDLVVWMGPAVLRGPRARAAGGLSLSSAHHRVWRHTQQG